jgi:hypothetical protein
MRRRRVRRAYWILVANFPSFSNEMEKTFQGTSSVLATRANALDTGITYVDLAGPLEAELISLDPGNAAAYVRLASASASVIASTERLRELEPKYDFEDPKWKAAFSLAARGLVESNTELARERVNALRVLRNAAPDEAEWMRVTVAAEKDLKVCEPYLEKMNQLVRDQKSRTDAQALAKR